MRIPRLGILVAALLGIAAVAGCAATDGGPDEGGGAGGPLPVTGTVTVFAAASLTEAFDALAMTFEQQHPAADVVLDYGGSAGLATQLLEGAPADVFAAADEATMRTVADAGVADDSAIFTTNTLELVVPAGNPAGVTGLADLADPGLAVALCDPAVPCGSAARALLAAAGVTPAPDTLEENVKAVLTKVEFGEADAGLVYVTDVRSAGGRVAGIPVPEARDAINRYPIAVLSGAPNPGAAREWVDLVLSVEGQRVLADAGFVAP